MLPKLKVKTADSSFTLRCDAAAWQRPQYNGGYDKSLLTLSAVGPDTAVKACRAMLYAPDVAVGFLFKPTDPDDHNVRMQKHRNGGRKYLMYDVKLAPIGRHAVHLVAKATLDGLMPDVSEAALWAELNSEDFTTPCLRSWIPWLRERLINEQLLVEAEGHNTSAGVLSATTEQLDELVSEGVREGHLQMKGERR